jgi:mRNA-degrading endonuclease RelE of RelBE toxin-antitoxin system
MTAPFTVETTSRFDRLFRKLAKAHPELSKHLGEVTKVLQSDPYNKSRSHQIKKLVNVAAGDGQHRIRIARFRFRYDIAGSTVTLIRCSLRRENTY